MQQLALSEKEESSMKVNLINYSNLFGPPKNDHPLIAGVLDFMEGYWVDKSNNNIQNIVQYLVDNPSSSLLNLITITMEVIDTKDITRMFVADPLFYTFELSLPYGDDSLNFITRDIKTEDQVSTQLSTHYNIQEWGETLLNNEWKELQYRTIRQSQEYYNTARSSGISQIEAEAILPLGLSESKIYVQGTLKNWINFIKSYKASPMTFEQKNAVDACADKLKEIAPFVQPLL